MEEWRLIKNFSFYEISDKGKVRSKYCRKGKEIILKQATKSNGYKQVTLVKGDKRKSALVHRLVAEAFLGSSDLQVNHKNLNKGDNRLNNLEYVTPSENAYHSYRYHPTHRANNLKSRRERAI